EIRACGGPGGAVGARAGRDQLASESRSRRFWETANHEAEGLFIRSAPLTHTDHILDRLQPDAYMAGVASRLRKVTVNLPADLPGEAGRTRARGFPPRMGGGPQELRRPASRWARRELGGKVRFGSDLETPRR